MRFEIGAPETGKDLAVPVERAGKVSAQTLILDGGANLTIMPFMHASATKLAKAVPHGRQRTLEGQGHDVKAEALAPVLVEFFEG